MLAHQQKSEIDIPFDFELLERHLLCEKQVDAPVSHYFGPGVYIREVVLLAGTFAIGHFQKHDHMNVMIRGRVAIIDGGEVKELQAPFIFTGRPGRKIGYIIEDTTWWNVYSNPDEERNIDKLESIHLEKSDTWSSFDFMSLSERMMSRDEDRNDFFELMKDAGISPDIARAQSEDEKDQIPMPDGYCVTVRKSPIDGLGLFSPFPIREGSVIAPARISGMRTPAGRYANHSRRPNAEFVLNGNDVYLVAKRNIGGCKGGDSGEEITVDYRQALSLSKIGVSS